MFPRHLPQLVPSVFHFQEMPSPPVGWTVKKLQQELNGQFIFPPLHPFPFLDFVFPCHLVPYFQGEEVAFFLSVFLMLTIELLLLSPETGQCRAIREERDA